MILQQLWDLPNLPQTMARVSNQFLCTNILPPNSDGSQRVTLSPIYIGDPNFQNGIYLADNTERAIEILVPKNSLSPDFFKRDSKYYMDFTLVT